MSRSQIIDNNGEVIGGFSKPVKTVITGWAFNNTSASIRSVGFWAPTGTSVNTPATPSNSTGSSLQFTIQVPANQSVVFKSPHVLFKDGVFAITSDATCTGVVWYE